MNTVTKNMLALTLGLGMSTGAFAQAPATEPVKAHTSPRVEHQVSKAAPASAPAATNSMNALPASNKAAHAQGQASKAVKPSAASKSAAAPKKAALEAAHVSAQNKHEKVETPVTVAKPTK